MTDATPIWWLAPTRSLDQDAGHAARTRQDNLTKPPGSLGRLEELAIRLAAMQGREKPHLDAPTHAPLVSAAFIRKVVVKIAV